MEKMTIKNFLDLPAGALPRCRFTEPDDSWAADAWEVLRESARTGEAVQSLCGTGILMTADRPEWRDGIEIG